MDTQTLLIYFRGNKKILEFFGISFFFVAGEVFWDSVVRGACRGLEKG